MTFSGFTGGLNKLVHALNGNIQYLPGTKPKPHSMLWRTSFNVPNGMTVFRYRFYGKEALWLHAMWRGQYFELDTTRSDSKTLYGIVLRAVASTGGGPGSRWPLLQAYRRRANSIGASRGYQRQADPPNAGSPQERQLPRGEPPRAAPINPTPQYSSYRHLRYAGAEPRVATTLMPGGYQHRGAHGGTQRGRRSTEAQYRRYSLWQVRRRAQLQDYRQWKTQQKDSALRVHGRLSPPPIHLKPTTQQRLQRRFI